MTEAEVKIACKTECRSYNIVIIFDKGPLPESQEGLDAILKNVAWSHSKRVIQAELGHFLSWDAEVIERGPDPLGPYIVRLIACPLMPGD